MVPIFRFSPKYVLVGVLIIHWLLVSRSATAQSGTVEEDSLRSYELAEIVVGGSEEDSEYTPTTLHKVSLAGLVRQDAVSISEVAKLIPAALVQTNSRGETLVYLRGAGERQVAFFFDGAQLNVPWDNRVDLSMVPSAVVGGVTVAQGVPSVLFGTNVIGGAVNLTSRSLARSGSSTEGSTMFGSEGFRQVTATQLFRQGPFSFAGSAGYAKRDGITLSNAAHLPFSQSSLHRRTNTDRTMWNLFGRASYRFGETSEIGLSILNVQGKKGVAPESHLDPTTDRVRFWRYPLWQNSMVILNGTAPLFGRGNLHGAAWGSLFKQYIDQYQSAAYRIRSDREEDDDQSLGTRLVYSLPAQGGVLRISLNAQTSRHAQRDFSFENAGATDGVPPELIFRQDMYSLGAEYDIRIGKRFDVLAGVSYDGVSTPRTGDKPARDPFHDFGFTSGMVYNLTERLGWRLSVGRKVRFPTMRELFDGALRRFLVNPNLNPESSILAETGLVTNGERLSGEVMLFTNRTFDTIDQQSVTGEDGVRRRRRINLDGSRILGVEVTGAFDPFQRWSLEGHFTWMTHRAFLDNEPDRSLVERPAILSTLSLVHNTSWGGSFLIQSSYTGRAYSLNPDNTLAKLPTALVLNARAAYRIYIPSRRFFGEIFVRVNNMTDETVLPQLGLPGPGRELKSGVSISF